MINTTCFLTNKGKLDVTLHGECKYFVFSKEDLCEGCPYYPHKEVLERRYRLRDTMISFYSINLEKEMVRILKHEIKELQDKRFIKKEAKCDT